LADVEEGSKQEFTASMATVLRIGPDRIVAPDRYSNFEEINKCDKTDKYPTAPCTAIQLDVDQACGTPAGFTDNDLSGQETTYAPEYTASLFFDYITDIGGSGMEFFAGGEYNYSDDSSPVGDNDPLDRIDGYSKTNLRLGLRGERWEVMAYGRNIFDEEVFSESMDVPVLAGSHFKHIDEGSVFGARFKYDF
jgi:iron complex outermembrane receptor protein